MQNIIFSYSEKGSLISMKDKFFKKKKEREKEQQKTQKNLESTVK